MDYVKYDSIRVTSIWLVFHIGALTNKPYAFKNRPWELSYVNTTDILDALGSSINVYLYGSEIKRILSLKNDTINEDWISNRTRYFFEGLTKWRINIPLMKKNKILVYISWIQSFYFFLLKIWFYSVFIKSKVLGFILNFIVDYELLITTRILANLIGFSLFNFNKINYINDFYLFYINPLFFNNIKNKNIYVFIGINLRLESPILNIKLRKKNFNENLIYCNIGSSFNDNLNILSLGISIKNLLKFLKGKLTFNINIGKLIKKNFNKNNLNSFFMFFLGNNIICQKDSIFIHKILLNNIKNLNLFNILKYNNNKKYIIWEYINIFKDYIFFSKKSIEMNLNVIYLNLFSIVYNEIIVEKIHNNLNFKLLDIIYILNGNFFLEKKDNKFIIFQGHHIDIKLLNVDLILPNVTFLEKMSKFLNIEGNLLKTNKVVTKPNLSKNDWAILNALYLYSIKFLNKIYNFSIKKKIFNFLNSNRFYIHLNSLNKLINYMKKYSVNYFFSEISKYNLYKNKLECIFNKKYIQPIIKIFNKIIINYHYNNYELNIIDKNSQTLKFSSKYFSQNVRNYIKIN